MIYALDADPTQAARMLCDAHIAKLPLASARLLSTAWHWYRATPGKIELPPAFQLSNPWAHWLLRNRVNYGWMAAHAQEQALQYVWRFNRRHPSTDVILALRYNPYALQKGALTPFPKPVAAYRALYLEKKMGFAHWRHTQTPEWVIAGNCSTNERQL